MSWSSVKTEAIVLSIFPFRESDRRYRALTPEHGKIEFVGRGAQKEKAKLAAHLEPFSIVEIEIIRGRRSTTVISVERKYGFNKIAKNLEKRLLAESSLVLLDRYTGELDADQALYQNLVDWLTFLDQKIEIRQTRSTFLLGGFLLRMLTRLGYEIELRHCLSCKEEILPNSFKWHGGQGGLVCSNCQKEEEKDWFSAVNVSEETIKLIRFARDKKYQDLLLPALKGENMNEFAQVVHDLVMYHIPGAGDRPFWQGILADWELESTIENM